MRRSKLLAGLCAVMALLICASILLPLTHTHDAAHPCTVCPVCLMAQKLQSLLVLLFFLLLMRGIAAFVSLQAPGQLRPRPSEGSARTPVSLKTRMNN